MKFSIGYITAPTKTEAKDIIMELLDRELIACANILPGAESFYVWDGELQHEKEVVIIIKTLKSNEKKILKVVKALHSYECPCIVFAPIHGGDKDFLRWIAGSC